MTTRIPTLFVIRAGTQVSICKADGSARLWTPYRTQQEIVAPQAEVAAGRGEIVLEHRGWLILSRNPQARPFRQRRGKGSLEVCR